jgi:hypothetical protein
MPAALLMHTSIAFPQKSPDEEEPIRPPPVVVEEPWPGNGGPSDPGWFDPGGPGPGIDPGIEPVPVEVALATFDSVDDLQCAKQGAGQFTKEQLNALGRVTSQSSYTDRHDAMAALVAIARVTNSLGALIIDRGGLVGSATGLGPIIAGITYADGGYETWRLELSTYTGNSVTGSPERMGDGVAKTANCGKG